MAHTGGFGEPTCQICHMGMDVNEPGGSLTVTGLEETYEPGRVYRVTLTLDSEGTEAAGFQASVRYLAGTSTGRDAGRISSVDERTAFKRSESGVTYVHQTKTAAKVASSRVSWMFDWEAPVDVGPVALHVAANSGNGDASPFGDLIYTASREMDPT